MNLEMLNHPVLFVIAMMFAIIALAHITAFLASKVGLVGLSRFLTFQ